MLTLMSNSSSYVITPTIFPDNTTQVWKLPKDYLHKDEYLIVWNYENERELIDLGSLVFLLREGNQNCFITVHIPYLPYARQDKDVSNELTFNLRVFAHYLNSLKLNRISTIDVHNRELTSNLIENVIHYGVEHIHNEVINEFNPDFLFFPDEGALNRYSFTSQRFKSFCGQKIRNQETGQITDYQINFPEDFKNKSKVLIIDDICDGGATFIEAAKQMRATFGMYDKLEIGLLVSHGIFSKGKEHLLKNSIDKIWTTNSLPKNTEGFIV